MADYIYTLCIYYIYSGTDSMSNYGSKYVPIMPILGMLK